jgi:hypothetical protein
VHDKSESSDDIDSIQESDISDNLAKDGKESDKVNSKDKVSSTDPNVKEIPKSSKEEVNIINQEATIRAQDKSSKSEDNNKKLDENIEEDKKLSEDEGKNDQDEHAKTNLEENNLAKSLKNEKFKVGFDKKGNSKNTQSTRQLHTYSTTES